MEIEENSFSPFFPLLCEREVETTFLESQLKDNKLDTREDRQKVAAVFTKETKETFDVERMNTWFRNHKKKNISTRGGGKRGRVVRKVRHNSHLSHGEIVLVTNDDDILGYKA